MVAVLLTVLAVEGQPVAASQASIKVRRMAWSHRAGGSAAQVAARQAGTGVVDAAAADDRPDLRVAFGPVDDVQAGQPFRWVMQLRNDGGSTNGAALSALAPPEMSNVRVTAPGFVCTRRFTASGADAGTLVACTRNDFERGASAAVTVEATAPGDPGRYHLTAVADPRDDVSESDEANNAATLSVEVQG
jgi:hypothetical protein